MPKKSLKEFLGKQENYLPSFLKDFHDQKDFFKTLWHDTLHVRTKNDVMEPYIRRLDWVLIHTFIIDDFLRYMAAHGWTLQRARQQVEFLDLEEAIERRKTEDAEVLRRWLTGTKEPQKSDE